MTFNYSLDSEHYSWKNALGWGNFTEHCKIASKESGCSRFIHILIAMAEFLPVLGQIASIFEKLIVSACSNHPPVNSSTDKNEPSPSKTLSSKNIVDETALKNITDKSIKSNAARKIQRTYRKHAAQLASKKLERDQLEKAKQELEEKAQKEREKLQLEAEEKKKAMLLALEKEKEVVKLGYKLSLRTSWTESKDFTIDTPKDIEDILKFMSDKIQSSHRAIEAYNRSWHKDVEILIKLFKDSPFSQNLEIIKESNDCIRICPKPKSEEPLKDGYARYTYDNGIVEECIRDKDGRSNGLRIYPDGRKEKGKFNNLGDFYSGYKVGIDGKIEYVDPDNILSLEMSLAKASKQERTQYIKYCVSEIDGKLVVLQKAEKIDKYIPSEMPIKELVLKACLKKKNGFETSIKQVLQHPEFDRKELVEAALKADSSGTPLLFSFHAKAAVELLEAELKNGTMDPQKIVDPVSKRNFFVETAFHRNYEQLEKLIELFPKAFLEVGVQVIEVLLKNGYYVSNKVLDTYRSLGGKFSPFHEIWISVAKRNKPGERFEKEIDALSESEKRTIYDAAYTYGNFDVHEFAETPVPADHYSINFLWINKDAMPSEQEFLFGSGKLPAHRAAEFKKGFVEPIANWTKANPGTTVNIWYDGVLATKSAVENSKKALLSELDPQHHSKIVFRDVHTLDDVQKNPTVFTSEMPVYFRVDILKGITADHCLSKKESKYFVFCDLDVKAKTGRELFDKRTLGFLNEFGFVMAMGGKLKFENSFQIFNGDHKQIMESHRKVIIDLSIDMALNARGSIQEQQIYDTYQCMLVHFLDADGRYGRFTPKIHRDDSAKKEKAKKEDPATRLKLLRYDRYKNEQYEKLPFDKVKNVDFTTIMPRKPVDVPPSHFGS